MVLQKVSVTVALVGPLAAGNELHRCIDQKGIDQGFEFNLASLSGVPMLGLESIKVYASQRASQSRDGNVGRVLIGGEVGVRDIIFNVAVGGKKCTCAY